MRPTSLVATSAAVLCLALASCRSGSCCGARLAPAAPPGPSITVAEIDPAEPAVLMETLVVRVPAARAAAVLGAREGTAVLGAREADALRAHARDPRVETLALPTVVALPGGEASLFVGEESSAGEDAWTGWALRCRATPQAQGGGLAMDVSFAWRPASEGASDAAALAASEVRVRGHVDLVPAGDSVLCVERVRDGSDDRVAILVQPRLIDVP